MKFEIGDKVKFLNEKGKGTVTRIINKTTVGVTIEDGFEIPYAISDLVFEIEKNDKVTAPHSSPTQIPREIEQPVNESSQNDSKVEEEGLYLAFSPENSRHMAGSDINVWLINHTPYTIVFTYSVWNNGSYYMIETGNISNFNAELVQTIYRNELNDHRNFKIDALFFKKQEYEHQQPVSNVIKLKPIKLYKENAFKENGFIADKALIFPIYLFRDKELISEPFMITEQKLAKISFQKSKVSDKPKISKPHATNN